MKLRIVCKDDTNNYNDDLCIKCEMCRGRDISTTIKMLQNEYNIDEIIIPDCEIVKKRLKMFLK